MNKTLLLFTSLVLVVISCSQDDLQKDSKVAEFEPIEFERTIKNIRFEEEELFLEEEIELLAPMSLKFANNRFYVADNIRGKIYSFNESWVLQDSITNGEGRGPGELLKILDFEVGKQFVWVIDGNQLSVNKFTLDNNFVSSVTLKKVPTRLTLSNSDIVILNTGSGGLFSVVDQGSLNHKNEFGVFVEDQEINFMSLFGHLEERKDEGFIYIPKYQSSIYYYNSKYEIEFIKNRPDGKEFPTKKATRKEGETEMRAPRAEIPAFETSSYGNRLYIGNYLQNFGDKGEDILDVFDYENGEYLESYIMPFGCVDFFVKENDFFCLEKGERISAYKMIFD
jgi:hypothetical protein